MRHTCVNSEASPGGPIEVHSMSDKPCTLYAWVETVKDTPVLWLELSLDRGPSAAIIQHYIALMVNFDRIFPPHPPAPPERVVSLVLPTATRGLELEEKEKILNMDDDRRETKSSSHHCTDTLGAMRYLIVG